MNALLEAKRALEERALADPRFEWVPTCWRREVQLRYSWAIPSTEAIARLVALSPLVEVGAGTGYWSSLIADAGGDIVAFDSHPAGLPSYYVGGTMENPVWHSDQRPFYPVAVGSAAEVAAAYPERTLFLCWPPNNEPMAADAIAAYHGAGGRRVVYVGEVHGVTGDARFLALCGWPPWCLHHDGEDPEADCACIPEAPLFTKTAVVSIPNWQGLNDSLYILERADG